MRKNLIIFAREPEVGFVKTRLAVAVGNEMAFEFYKAFLKDLKRIIESSIDDDVNKYVFYAGSSADKLTSIFSDFKLIEQSGGGLGTRMSNAFKQMNLDSSTIIIGSDCLTFKKDDFTKAYEMLLNVDLVLQPTFDGGYSLIAMKDLNENIFKNIDWGSEEVLSQTLTHATKANLKVGFLDKTNDIDTIDDLELLINQIDPSTIPATYQTYQKLLARQ